MVMLCKRNQASNSCTSIKNHRRNTMKTVLIHSAHTVGETNLHLQFTPAYRQDIFSDQLVRELTTAYLVERANQLKVKVSAVDCGPDHLHIFVEHWKNQL